MPLCGGRQKGTSYLSPGIAQFWRDSDTYEGDPPARISGCEPIAIGRQLAARTKGNGSVPSDWKSFPHLVGGAGADHYSLTKSGGGAELHGQDRCVHARD